MCMCVCLSVCVCACVRVCIVSVVVHVTIYVRVYTCSSSICNLLFRIYLVQLRTPRLKTQLSYSGLHTAYINFTGFTESQLVADFTRPSLSALHSMRRGVHERTEREFSGLDQQRL